MTKRARLEQQFNDISTGDEIHLTNGDIWSCVPRQMGSTDLGVWFINQSFESAREDGEFSIVGVELIPASVMRGLLHDAVMGGAKIVKGVGLV